MTDRELLELAAKAARIKLLWSSEKSMSPREANSLMLWNPLTDDAEALRLAVKLEIAVYRSFQYWTAEKCANYSDERPGDDPCAAVRRAIVRAAAAIGKEPQP